MRYSQHERAVARVELPKPDVTVEVTLPQESTPPGIDKILSQLGWDPTTTATGATMFHRAGKDGPYAGGFYHWYEIVCLEALNLLTIGQARHEANLRAHGPAEMAQTQAAAGAGFAGAPR